MEAEREELKRYLENPRGLEDDIACSRGVIRELEQEIEQLEGKYNFV